MGRQLSWSAPSNPGRQFRVGQNQRGQWIAVDAGGACGGIFTSRAAAVHYAEFETDHRPGAVSMSSAMIELEI